MTHYCWYKHLIVTLYSPPDKMTFEATTSRIFTPRKPNSVFQNPDLTLASATHSIQWSSISKFPIPSRSMRKEDVTFLSSKKLRRMRRCPLRPSGLTLSITLIATVPLTHTHFFPVIWSYL